LVAGLSPGGVSANNAPPGDPSGGFGPFPGYPQANGQVTDGYPAIGRSARQFNESGDCIEGINALHGS
jgi:hypothetical protein